MTSVILAILSAAGGAIAGIVPVLAVSQRRRLLKLIEEESKAAEAVHDPHAKEHLLKSLRATASRYQEIAWREPLMKAKRRMRTIGAPCIIVMALSALVALRVGDITDSKHRQGVIAVAALSVGTVAWVVMLAAFLALTFAAMDSRDESKALKKTRAKNARLRETSKAMVESAVPMQRAIEESKASGTGQIELSGTGVSALSAAAEAALEKAVREWSETVDNARAALDADAEEQQLRWRIKERRRRFQEFAVQHGRKPSASERARIYRQVDEDQRKLQEANEQPALDLGTVSETGERNDES